MKIVKYCLISVCSYFVIILKVYIFSNHSNSHLSLVGAYSMAGGCFTDVLHSL
jgi:uncharacterized membrane protein (GlpM family)